MQQGRQLRPQPWNKTGRIKVQFQRGLLVPKAFLQNGRLQVDPVPEAAFQSPRFERRRLTRTRIRIRVNANEDRSPVWLTVPALLHRPLPPGGSIRGVSFVRERIGLGFRHRVLFTVSDIAFPDSSKQGKAVGVDLGWRLTINGLRIAYWAGADGKRGELVLPMSDLTEFKRVGTLQLRLLLRTSRLGLWSLRSVPVMQCQTNSRTSCMRLRVHQRRGRSFTYSKNGKRTGLLATGMHSQNCAPGTNSMSTCGRGRRIFVINFFDGGGNFIADLQRVSQNGTERSLSTTSRYAAWQSSRQRQRGSSPSSDSTVSLRQSASCIASSRTRPKNVVRF